MCRELEDAEIPANVRTVKREAFRYCEKLKVALPYGLERIEALAFEDCLADSIVLPSTVKYLEGAPFRHVKGLKKIYSLAETPPVCTIDPQRFTDGINPFDGSAPKDIPIYVPIGSAEKYRKAIGWDYFTNFIETSKLPAGIETPGQARLSRPLFCLQHGRCNDSARLSHGFAHPASARKRHLRCPYRQCRVQDIAVKP